MSKSAGIYIGFHKPVEATSLVLDLLESGWAYDDYGKISYLPLGDDDKFDWQRVDLDRWDYVLDVIDKKAKLQELVGLALTWNNTNIGGEFLIDGRGLYLTVSLTINRKVIEGTRETDFMWYEAKVSQFLVSRGYEISSVKNEQID